MQRQYLRCVRMPSKWQRVNRIRLRLRFVNHPRGKSVATWVIASDFAGRIANLIQALGDIEPTDLAERASVGAEQVRRWLRNEAKPRHKALERWAKREGWRVDIFAEGGPMPASVVNSAVNNRPGEVRERGATYGVGSPTGEPVAPDGNDPMQEIRAMEATGILERGAKAADKLLNLGRLDEAVEKLWWIIGAASRELRDGGMEGGGPAPEPAPEPRRPRVASTDLSERKRKLKEAREVGDREEEE